MLYENEKIQLWNPETGELSGKDEVVEEEVTRIIEEGLALSTLKGHSGWKIIENLLLATTTDLKDKLAYEQDIEKIRRLQEAIKAYQNVLTFVDYKIAEGKALEENNQAPIEG
jgi:hypothetical protein